MLSEAKAFQRRTKPQSLSKSPWSDQSVLQGVKAICGREIEEALRLSGTATTLLSLSQQATLTKSTGTPAMAQIGALDCFKVAKFSLNLNKTALAHEASVAGSMA